MYQKEDKVNNDREEVLIDTGRNSLLITDEGIESKKKSKKSKNFIKGNVRPFIYYWMKRRKKKYTLLGEKEV